MEADFRRRLTTIESGARDTQTQPSDVPLRLRQRPTHVRHKILGLIFLIAVVTYVDRVCISLAAPIITRDFSLSAVEMGTVFSVFALAYALFEVPTGWLGDRFGARRTLSRVIAWWSLFTALTGLVRSFPTLIAVRFLFGAGEAGAYPNFTRAIRSWFPTERRGTAMGTVWMGSRLGAAITAPVVLLLFRWIGWRNTFHLLGVVGIIVAGLWYWYFRDDPREKSSVNAAELALIESESGSHRVASRNSVSWKALITDGNIWSIDLMYFTLGFTYYLYISWFPSYLLKARGVPISSLAIYASLPLWFSAFATLGGGAMTDRLVQLWGLAWGRRAVGIAGCAGSATFLVAGLQASDTRLAVLLISLAAASGDFTLATCWSTCADIGGPNSGTISGSMNMIGNIGSVLSPLVMGSLVQWVANWDITFYLAAGLNIIAMLLWLKIDASKKLTFLSAPGAAP